MTDDDDEDVLELDLRGYEEPFDPEAPLSPFDRLESLLSPFGYEPVDKARELVVRGAVTPLKAEGQVSWYSVRGSRPYVVTVTTGEDFVYAECTCPNGAARGGDTNCYHSIAARVVNAGLAETWMRS